MRLVMTVVIVLAAVGCVKSKAIECSDGRTCPSGTTCDVPRGLCLVAGQLEACAGKAEGDPCSFAEVAGRCYDGLCATSTCGDKRIGPGEVCDDGNLASADGCRGDCRSTEICGNGVTDFATGEECDCGEFDPPALGCDAINSMTSPRATCRKDCKLRCGDLVVQPGEVCDGVAPVGQTCLDYGFDTGTLGCSADVCAPAFIGCEQFGWAPVDPGAPEVKLNAVWGSGADDIFAVGDLGIIVHWNGVTWTKMNLPPASPHFSGVWGAPPTMSTPSARLTSCSGSLATITGISVGADMVVAIGDDGIVFYSTQAMSGYTVFHCVMTAFIGLPRLFDIWNLDSTHDVFAVGNNGEIYRRRVAVNDWVVTSVNWGATPPNPLPALTTIFGFSDSVLFAGGGNGLILRWNGSVWTPMATNTVSAITDIWGPAPNGLFAVGTNGAILHFDGTSWTKMTSNTANRLEAVWGTSATDVFATGGDTLLHYDGTAWVQVRDAALELILDLVGLGARTYGVGANGATELLLRF